MTSFNRETLIFLGIAVLLVNIVVSAALRRKFLVVNAIVAVVAGVIVLAGIAQVTLLPVAAASATSAAAISTGNTATSGASNANPTTTNVSFGNGRANGASQSQVATAQANATAAATGSVTGSASGSTNATGRGNGAGGTFAGRNSAAAAASTSPVSTLVAAAQTYVPFLTIAGGLLVLFAGMLYYASESQQATFKRLRSLGFLNMCIGLSIVVLMVGLPMIVAQASSSARAAVVVVTQQNGPAAARRNMPTPTPTQMPAPSATPAPLPTLTPTPIPTSIVLSTPIPYTSNAQPSAVTACSASAQTLMNLRNSPSSSQAAIGRVLAGSLLKVTGKSADGQWYHVITPDNISGWVSAQYVTTYSGCTAASVPVVSSTPTH